MMKTFVYPCLALAALAACDAPTSESIVINPDGLERVEQLGAAAIAPSVTPQLAIQTFENYCGRFPANPGGTKRAVEAAGYTLFVSGSVDNLEMYASPDGSPMVATGSQDGAEVCMILMQEGRDLSQTIESYVRQKHGDAVFSMGSLEMPQGEAENVWAAQGGAPIIYFTLVQQQPGLGRVEAIAQVTE